MAACGGKQFCEEEAMELDQQSMGVAAAMAAMSSG